MRKLLAVVVALVPTFAGVVAVAMPIAPAALFSTPADSDARARPQDAPRVIWAPVQLDRPTAAEGNGLTLPRAPVAAPTARYRKTSLGTRLLWNRVVLLSNRRLAVLWFHLP